MSRVYTQTLYEDFAGLIPQDGSVESVQDYDYFSDRNLRIAASPAPTRQVLKLERFHRDNPLLPPPPLNLGEGAFLRVQCLHGYQYAYGTGNWVKRVIPGAPGSGSGLIVLAHPLNDDPTPGGEVLRIKGRGLHYVDYRLFERVEKGEVLAVEGRYYQRKNLPKEYW